MDETRDFLIIIAYRRDIWQVAAPWIFYSWSSLWIIASILTSFHRFSAAAACAHLIFSYDCANSLLLRAPLMSFTSTTTAFCCCSSCKSCCFLEWVVIFFVRFLNQLQVVIVKFRNFLHIGLLCLLVLTMKLRLVMCMALMIHIRAILIEAWILKLIIDREAHLIFWAHVAFQSVELIEWLSTKDAVETCGLSFIIAYDWSCLSILVASRSRVRLKLINFIFLFIHNSIALVNGRIFVISILFFRQYICLERIYTLSAFWKGAPSIA